jgi:hypothetical protein
MPFSKKNQKYNAAAIPPGGMGLTANSSGGQPLNTVSRNGKDMIIRKVYLQNGPRPTLAARGFGVQTP